MSWKVILVVLTITAAVPAFSQVAPSASEGRLPLKIGGGFSDFLSSDGGPRLTGGAVWVDSSPTLLPRSLRGLGVEAESRYVTTGGPSRPNLTGIFHQGTIGGGPTYTLFRYRRLRPYAKFLVDFAGMGFNVGARAYRHETEVVYAPGGGVDYQVFSKLWARVDYEYQVWPNPFSNPNWTFDPQGFTVGMAWDLGSMHRH